MKCYSGIETQILGKTIFPTKNNVSAFAYTEFKLELETELGNK